MGRLGDRELVVKGYALDREDDPEFEVLMVRSVVVDPKVKTRGNYGRQCRPSRRGLEMFTRADFQFLDSHFALGSTAYPFDCARSRTLSARFAQKKQPSWEQLSGAKTVPGTDG
jgi:hypothetical protein